MTDAGFVIAAYGVVGGGLVLYAAWLALLLAFDLVMLAVGAATYGLALEN
jgi:hypothetical protein